MVVLAPPPASPIPLAADQGVFMYWIPSSAFQMCQAQAMKNDKFREFLGLQSIKAPPRAAAGGAPPPADQKVVGASTDQKAIGASSSQAVV